MVVVVVRYQVVMGEAGGGKYGYSTGFVWIKV